MAHYQQLKFIKEVSEEYPEYFKNQSVLEIGSWDTNGSIRNMFVDCNYIGVDIAEGPGVDVVGQGQDLKYAHESFDVVVSCECFEHNMFWKETFSNMLRMLKPEGICLITCATLGRREHGTVRTNPVASLTANNSSEQDGNYYVNLRKKDFEQAVKLHEVFSNYHFFTNIYSKDLYFLGFKKPMNQQVKINISLDLIDKIKAIKRVKKTNIISHITKIVKFWFTYYYALIIGEKNFHNLRLKK